MNAERAYRTSVRPLSILLVACGVIFAVCAWGVRVRIASPFPFVESESLSRHFFGAAGLLCVGIGTGLWLRYRLAWYALLVYLGVGVLLPAVAALDARFVASTGYAFSILGAILNGAIGAGIYFATRPAFAHAEGQRSRDKTTIGRGAVMLMCLSLSQAFVPGPVWAGEAKKPAVLIINGRHQTPLIKGDFTYFRQLHGRGF